MDKYKKDVEEEVARKREEFSKHVRKAQRESVLKKTRGVLLQKNNVLHQNLHIQQMQQISSFLNLNFHPKQIAQLKQRISSNNIVENHYGIIGFRKLLTLPQPPFQEILDSQAAYNMIKFAEQLKYPHLKYQALWCLTNIITSSNYHCQCLIDRGVINIFFAGLQSKYKEIIQQSIWGIGNISADSTSHRDLCLKMGIKKLIKQIRQLKTQQMRDTGAWVLSNLTRGNPQPTFQSIKQTIPTFSEYLKSQQSTIKQLQYCLWSLSFITQLPKKRNKLIIQNGIQKQLFRLIKHQKTSIVIPAIRTIGNLINTVRSDIIQAVLKNDISYFYELLCHQKQIIRRQTCWTISNILGGKQQHGIPIIKNQKLIQRIIQIYKTDSLQVIYEASYILSNSFKNINPQHTFYIANNYNIVQKIIEYIGNQNSKIIMTNLLLLKQIIWFGEKKKINQKNIVLEEFIKKGGAQILQKLNYHSNIAIYQQAYNIMCTFFEQQ